MSTKSRQVIFGSRIEGAEIRAGALLANGTCDLQASADDDEQQPKVA